MRTTAVRISFFLAAMLIASPAIAQTESQLITIPISNPAEPVTVDISILSARIEVIGEDRQDAEFTVSVEQGSRKIVTPSGTKELSASAYSLEIEEEDNYISVDTDWRADRVTIVARVPRRADLELSTVNDGEILVSNISGSMQLENTNGPITATDVAGSIIAESVNETIDVSFTEIDESSAMSFETINGDLLIGIPSRAGVQFHIDNANGEIVSDFEVDVQASKPVIERRDDRGGVEVRVESTIVANVNGGGTVIKLTTLHGDIHIRDSGN